MKTFDIREVFRKQKMRLNCEI